MAKKKRTRKGGFNMSAAVRDLLTQDPTLSGKQVQEALKKKFPGQKINPNSCGVAFSMARKKLGIRKKTKSVRKRRPSAGRSVKASAIDMSALQAARKYVSEVGDVDAALDAVRKLKTLQIG